MISTPIGADPLVSSRPPGRLGARLKVSPAKASAADLRVRPSIQLATRLLTVICTLTCCLAAEDNTTHADWPHYGGQRSAWRYSSLDHINRSNVDHLQAVWAFQTGKVDGGFNATPVVVDGVMYVASSWNRIFAINAETGKEI